ncbi:hypothetical protein B0H12DRAFT_1128084, partial [Mycena haematopus]
MSDLADTRKVAERDGFYDFRTRFRGVNQIVTSAKAGRFRIRHRAVVLSSTLLLLDLLKVWFFMDPRYVSASTKCF